MRFACLLCAVSALLNGQTAPALLEQAQRLFQRQRYEETLRTLERCLATDPRNADAYKLVALSAIRLNRLDIAEPALKSAEELAPGDYAAHFHLGALYYTRSEFLIARPELERAVALNPQYMPGHVFLGLTYEELGDNEAAIASYRKAIALVPSQQAGKEAPYLHLARLLYRLHRFDESLPILDKAVELNPASGDALLTLGKSLHAVHRDADAVAALQRCTALQPDNPDAHYTLYRILTAQAKAAEAAVELDRFHEAKLFTPHGERAVVLLFIRTDCPISNRYVPEIQRLHAKFSSAKIDFRLVYPESGLTTSAMEKHCQEFHYDIPAMLDSSHRLVDRARATVTPEAAVFVHGELAYLGRIDDRYVDIGQARTAADEHDLEAVLEPIAAGRQVAFRETKSIGCSIEKLR